jgi:hypothetical protein
LVAVGSGVEFVTALARTVCFVLCNFEREIDPDIGGRIRFRLRSDYGIRGGFQLDTFLLPVLLFPRVGRLSPSRSRC